MGFQGALYSSPIMPTDHSLSDSYSRITVVFPDWPLTITRDLIDLPGYEHDACSFVMVNAFILYAHNNMGFVCHVTTNLPILICRRLHGFLHTEKSFRSLI